MFNISAIVLASGYSKRMGSDKLSLEINGKAMYQHILDTIVNVNFKEVIVVSNNNEILDYSSNKSFTAVVNKESEEGKSASIRMGIKACSDDTFGYMFFPCDQPFITEDTIIDIIHEFLKSLNTITVPVYNDMKNGSPIIFPKIMYSNLMELKNDEGGSKLLKEFNYNTIQINSDIENIDIDTNEDYEKYKNGISV